MKIQTRATNVLERTSHYLKVGVLQNKPAWFDVVGAHPPAIDLTKRARSTNLHDPQIEQGSVKTRLSSFDRQNKHHDVHKIPKLQYLEDELRDVFYHQHPWEFSRPKTLVETSGDNTKGDWLRMVQLTKPLDGELVVQRTIWLAKNTELSLTEAYDKARFEFYQLRMQEEMKLTVAREELTMFGAVYPITNTQWGLEQEQEYIDAWTEVASNKTKVLLANKSQAQEVTQEVEADGSTFALEDDLPEAKE